MNLKQEFEEYEQDNEDDYDNENDYENYDLKLINFIIILGGIFMIGVFGVVVILVFVIKYLVLVKVEV